MGMFDSVIFKDVSGEEIELQFKFLDSEMKVYEIGDSIEAENGVYVDYDGCFVVFNGEVVAAFTSDSNPLRNKWGGEMNFPDITK